MAQAQEVEIVNPAGQGQCEQCGSAVCVLVLRGTLAVSAFCGSCATRRGVVDPEVLAEVQAGIALAHIYKALERQQRDAATEMGLLS